MVDAQTLALASAIVFVAAFAQSVTGFGFALILVPLLSLAWSVKATIVVSTILSTINLVPLVFRGRSHVRLSRLGPMLLGTFVGIPLGIVLLVRGAPGSLQAIIGFVVVAATLLIYFTPELRPPSPERFAPITAGMLSGVLRGATSMGGPPATLYLMSMEQEPAVFRATISWFFFPQSLLSVLLLVLAGRVTQNVVLLGAISLPALVVGHSLGSVVAPHVDSKLFRSAAGALLLLTGVAAVLAAAGVA